MELLNVLDDWRLDYQFDDNFVHAIELLENHILDHEYDLAAELFDEYMPWDMTEEEGFHFLQLLEEAKYYG